MKFPFPWLFWAQLSTQHRTYGFDVIIQRGHKVQSADQQLLRCLNVYLHSITGLKHKYTKKVKAIYIYYLYLCICFYIYAKIPCHDCTFKSQIVSEDNVPTQRQKVTGGGRGEEKSWGKTSVMRDVCKALVCYLSSPYNICCSLGAADCLWEPHLICMSSFVFTILT